MQTLTKQILVLLALTLVCQCQIAQAQTTVHGFGLEQYSSVNDSCAANVRIIAASKLNDELSFNLTLTATGSLPFWTYYDLTWKNPTVGVESLKIGRFFPIFGRDWADYRVDQVPMLTYSSIYGPLIAADTGISASGRSGKLAWTGAILIGDRLFGNVPKDSNSADYYFRAEYLANKTVTVGMSQRFGPTPASGIDLLICTGKSRITAEQVSSEGVSQESLQMEYQAGRNCTIAARQEWLNSTNRFGVAVTYALGSSIELKVLSEDNPDQVIVQTAVKF